ncbi:MAG: Hsp20/alpha crystallin family protein [Bacteroidales bacterium]|nr:Hsp20/alpha crystallin family protein [Bacteroidales bacterium]
MLPVLKTRSGMPSLIDDFFGRDLIGSFFNDQTGISMPAVNIVENADAFKIEVAAPGLEKNDFKIDLENNMLTISAEKEQNNEEKDLKYMRREFSYSSFKRSFSLPLTVDGEKIEAVHKDGVLLITLPKREEARPKPAKQIAIS